MVGALLAAVGILAVVVLLLGPARADAQTAGRESLVVLTTGPDDVSVSPDATLPAGATDVTLRNTGRAPAFMLLVRLNPGATLEQFRAFAGRSQAIPEDLITIVTSQFVDPGGKFQTSLALAAGNYLAMGNAPDGKGLGPVAEVTVGPETSTAPAARANARLTLFDFGIKAPARISGRSTLQIKNDGRNFHFLLGIRLKPGFNADEVVRSLTGRGPALKGEPGQFISVMGIVSPNTTNAVKVRLPAGRYVIACFFSDRHSNGHEHASFGMARKLTVTR
jgi:hypothetical protein